MPTLCGHPSYATNFHTINGGLTNYVLLHDMLVDIDNPLVSFEKYKYFIAVKTYSAITGGTLVVMVAPSIYCAKYQTNL